MKITPFFYSLTLFLLWLDSESPKKRVFKWDSFESFLKVWATSENLQYKGRDNVLENNDGTVQ